MYYLYIIDMPFKSDPDPLKNSMKPEPCLFYPGLLIRMNLSQIRHKIIDFYLFSPYSRVNIIGILILYYTAVCNNKRKVQF